MSATVDLRRGKNIYPFVSRQEVIWQQFNLVRFSLHFNIYFSNVICVG